MMRSSGFLLSVAVLVAAALLVPLPWLEIRAGPTYGTDELVTVTAGLPEDDTERSDRYLVTSVRLDEPTLVETVDAAFDGDVELVARASVRPGDVEPEQFIRAQRRLFEEGTRLAWAVGARAAGRDVTIEGAGVEVLAIVDSVPAAAELEVGDVITAVDGEPVRLTADVSAVLADKQPGDEVVTEVVRDDEDISATITLVEVGGMGDAGFGIVPRTVNRVIDMPVEVETADVDLVGPSAGLMIALAAHDRLADDPAVSDIVVAGTGTIDADGDVGTVGGVRQKVLAARDAGADVFLVPVTNAEAARDAADDDVEVLAVASLADAISALQDQ